MLDWIRAENYQFTCDLSREEWAWEFLRRNKGYQREWQSFMEVWNELEAAYGKPPNRDFCAWKLDSRAWVAASECSESDCRVDQDKVLIECALGARWGFYKFPPDPADDNAIAENRLTWRQPDSAWPVSEVSATDPDYLGQEAGKIALGFDLTLSLKEQLEQAKRYLQMTRKQRLRQGLITLKKLENMREQLTWCLRIADALNAGASDDQLTACFAGHDIRALVNESRFYLDKGYLELLKLG